MEAFADTRYPRAGGCDERAGRFRRNIAWACVQALANCPYRQIAGRGSRGDMTRLLAGGMAALLLVAGGLFWWQGRARSGPLPQALVGPPPPPAVEDLPEGDPDAVGKAPPMPAEASPQSREG